MNGGQTARFDVAGALPHGVTVLEASAGTGKTYAIAGLAARYVAEGTPLEDLLLVTFTRMATGELRERVRERLASVERALASRAVASGDPVAELLVRGDVATHRANLARALAGFDAGTIATTHAFCQEILGNLGVAGDLEREYTFVEEVSDLVEEVVDDLYLRRTVARGAPPFPHREARAIARLAVDLPGAPIEPSSAAEGSLPAMRQAFAAWVRREVEARKRRAALMSYDDLLTRLEAALRGSSAAVERLRARYRVVLVDEFQDTDPIQWEILRRAFAAEGHTLVLIGDPKQAIYAFRGADVYAYLDAASSDPRRPQLDTNWRSDQGLIDAHDALFAGCQLGHAGIVYRQVSAAPAHRSARMAGAPDSTPLRFRLVERGHPAITQTGGGLAEVESTRAHIATDLAADVVALLDSRAQLQTRDRDGQTLATAAIGPADIAVLVRTNRTATRIRDALKAAGVPAVINGAGSVFATHAAAHWLALLEALERPTVSTRARAAALTPFVGWTPRDAAMAEDDALEALHRLLHDWARILRLRGVAALAETITLSQGLAARVLPEPDGERELTDVRHVAELLHEAAMAEHAGTSALAAWLRRRIADAGEDTSDERRSRRLESDDDAVQVLTIHRSKGLEFPVVYCPDLWEPGRAINQGEPVAFHDPQEGDRWKVDVGLQGADYGRHRAQSTLERRGEDLRLTYVALTRARHQAVVWWAPTWRSEHSPLSRLVFSRDESGEVRPAGQAVPDDATARETFEALAARSSGTIRVAPARPGPPARWAGPRAGDPAELEVARFERGLDWRWRRTSFSDITAAAHEPQVASEPEERELDDEAAEIAPAPAPRRSDDGLEAALRAVASPLAGVTTGVEVGTLVHGVLEATDFTAEDLDGELGRALAEAQARRRVEVGDGDALLAGLRGALETPLGPLLDHARLRDVARRDRLDELAFELPLAGGDDPSAHVTLGALAALLHDRLPAGDPLAGYAQRLADPALRASVRGYLTGSLDLVVRRTGADGTPRYAVIDYKTNWLGAPGEPLSAWHYRPVALAAEMQRAHYALQALIYSAALHRYLRWRSPGYDPARQFAGVLYLFVRGMTGVEVPRVDGAPCGVFAWRAPEGLVAALSDLLDEGAPA